MRLLSVCLFLSATAPMSASAARSSMDEVLASFTRLVDFRQVVISPDGGRVAWVQSAGAREGPDLGKSAIYMVDRAAPDKPPVRLTAARAGEEQAEHDLAWSPDGRQLAFLSDAGGQPRPQLHVLDLASGKARRLTRLAGTLAEPRWSPDGKALAFLHLDGEDSRGALGPAPREVGVVQEIIHARRIHVVDLAGGPPRPVSPPDLFIYEYDWSPDSATFAATAARGDGEANWWIAELFVIAAATGQARSIHKPELQLAGPRWSPDGEAVAFIGGLMSDRGVTGGDIFLAPASGGAPKNLTPRMKASATWLTWTSNDRLLFGEHVNGEAGLATVSRSGGSITTLWSGGLEHVSSASEVAVSLAADGRTSAVIRQSYTRPAEIHAGPLGAWTPLTRLNEGFRPLWGEARKVYWTSDGARVQGWLLPPPEVEPGRRYPMVVWVHGGPAGLARPGFNSWQGALASQGYFVFLPNPRGSLGQGEAFTRANVRDFGGGDLRDILRGVDAVVKTEPVAGERVGIAGWSYGGFMTMWAVTQTRRFRAAVAGAGISNWQSYYGQNRIDTWMLPYFGASVYDAPERYVRRSPINFVKKAKTPTLILQGERDSEVPAPQAYEFWRALKTLGVDTQLVIYEGEGHRPLRLETRQDLIRRTATWFDRYLKR